MTELEKYMTVLIAYRDMLPEQVRQILPDIININHEHVVNTNSDNSGSIVINNNKKLYPTALDELIDIYNKQV